MDIIIILFIFYIVIFIGVYRNNQVYKYRMSLNDIGYTICMQYLSSINNKEYSNEQWETLKELRNFWETLLDTHSYEEMMIKFWKPLKDEIWLTNEQVNFLNFKFDRTI